MKLKLKDILPNPFRDLKTNPLIEEKVLGLMDSINLTGFWENVVVRKNSEGKFELAYGHHRKAAAQRAGIVEADFIVKKFDDAKMIQVMDNENRETYGSTPQSIIESVKAVVQSLAKGTISAFVLPPDVNKQHVRYAPSYIPGAVPSPASGERPYTAMSIATFLGRTRKGGKEADESVTAALDALFLKEKGRFSDSLLKKKDETGALVPITMNELRKRTGDIKRDFVRTEVRTEAAKKEAAEFDAKQRQLQADIREREQREAAKRKELVTKMAEAERKEDERKAKEIKDRIAAAEKDAADKAVVDGIRMAALEAKVEENKKREAEAKKEDDYLPIRREVERLLHKFEGDTSTNKAELTEEIKGLARKNLKMFDRDLLRTAAQKLGEWYSTWAADQFLPPFSVQKELSGYRSREEAKRRAQEAKERAQEAKEAKAAAKKEKAK